MEHDEPSRRDVLRLASVAPLAGVAGLRFDRRDRVRLGFIGLGGRGTALMRNFAAVDGVAVTALCDIVAGKLTRAQAALRDLGRGEAPGVYSGSERAFEELNRRDDIDVVVVATPWVWHTPMALDAMKHGKHAAIEVPAARTIDECWQLVRTSEQTRRHCMMLENCCYGYNELLVLNMVRAGLLGELTHGACAYDHDLREELFSNQGEGLWRRFEHLKRNGNLYPTHGLGPVARYMDIHRGDRFDYLVSMSSPSLSLASYRDRTTAADDPRRKESYACGDKNVSLIRTVKGRIITLEHDTSTPEPYDRINLIAGTKGIFRDYPPRIYLDSMGKHEWASIDAFKAQFGHPYWNDLGEKARRLGGHGGMDFIECYRLIECIRAGTAPDADVYDAAAWSAPGPLSEASVSKGSAPVLFPDFTRGAWKRDEKGP